MSIEHLNLLEGEGPPQRENFRVLDQEDIGWNKVPNKGERGGVQSTPG